MLEDNNIYKKFISWCKTNPNVFAVILTSSRSNPDSFIDKLSDYDIELHVKNISFCESNDQWIEEFGEIMVKWPLYPKIEFSNQWITRLVQFQDGTRIDFQITCEQPKYHENYDAGYKVIIDKENITLDIPKPDYKNLNIKIPDEEAFQDRINAFFWDAVYVAKSLFRDELYFAKFMLDSVLRFNNLQVIIEWYIGLHNNWNVTTNKYGRWFKKFLERDIWNKLEGTYAGAALEDNWKALYRMITLYSFLANEIATALNFSYPEKLEKDVTNYIMKIQKMKK